MFRDKLSFVHGVSKAIRRGHVFSADSRKPEAPAPGGSTRASPSFRPRNQAELFEHTVHRLAVPGLAHPMRVLHITDVHVRQQSDWLSALCERVSRLRGDMVLLTGDIVTRGWSQEAAGFFLRSLPEAPMGRFAVMGNWEYWGGADVRPWGEFLQDHGVTLLQNRWVQAGPLSVVGIDDMLAGQPDVDTALHGLPPERPALVMTHSPALFPVLQRDPVRLVLSGHSHSGQIRIPLIGSPFVPLGTGRYVGGWFQEDRRHLFVSRGVGWSIAPLRVFCRPELAELRLESA